MKTGCLLLTLAVARTVSAQAGAFDVATFVPPAGWTRSESAGLVSFQTSGVRDGRPIGCQLFVFASRPSGANPLTNFQAEWTAKITQPLRTPLRPAPQTEARPDGWTALSAFVDVPQNGLPYRTILFTATGSGLFMSVVVNYTVDACREEIASFFSSLRLRAPAAAQPSGPQRSAAPPAPATAQTTATARLADYVYTIPDTWTRLNDPTAIVLASPAYQGGEVCRLSLLPMRPVARGLPDDALGIFRELFGTEPLTGDIYPPTKFIRGTSPQGWEYFVVKKPIGPSGGAQVGAILLVARLGSDLAVIAGTSKAFLVSNCFGELVRDVWPPFFSSLRFRNATATAPDPAALRQRLAGAWITATATVALRYEFAADGRYADAAGARRRAPASPLVFFGNGAYTLDGNTLILTDDDRRRTTAQYRLEQESTDFGRTWADALCLLSPGASGEVCYRRDR